jgi:oxygen-independent coproporphyrinogen-3 oxidase|tara:strand:+ start:4882 stop:6285 length:1404 start_codon:yes stop_codon:yes gene_type:complete
MNKLLKNILNDINLLKKYDQHAFDYIEYPHKSFWNIKINQEDIIKNFEKVCIEEIPVMLYVHIPFCEQLCSFCICNRQITSDYKVVEDYLYNSLFTEIDLMTEITAKFKKQFNIREIYFGGGSPTFLKKNEFKKLKDKLKQLVNFEKINQFSIEIDPRRVDENGLLFYADEGVNKISFGIQDFDVNVQNKINRLQSVSIIQKLLTDNVRKRFKSINFDLLIGLPAQTVKSMSSTINEVIKLKPDRIALAYLAYNPEYHPHQRHMMIGELLPDFFRRKEIFVEALVRLEGSSYVRAGFEHFAVPEDDVTKSLRKKRAYYNSFGTTTGDCTSVLALGRSSYSTIGENIYYQNFYEQKKYQNSLKEGLIPLHRGWVLNKDDKLRRKIIKDLRTYFNLDINKLNSEYGIIFGEYFKREIKVLNEFSSDGLLTYNESNIVLSENGKHFSNLIGSIFDSFIKTSRYNEKIKIN